MAADDLTTTLRFTADTGNVEASLKRIVSSLQTVVRIAADATRASIQLAGAQSSSATSAAQAATSTGNLARSQTAAADAALRQVQALARLQQVQGDNEPSCTSLVPASATNDGRTRTSGRSSTAA